MKGKERINLKYNVECKGKKRKKMRKLSKIQKTGNETKDKAMTRKDSDVNNSIGKHRLDIKETEGGVKVR